MKQSKVIFGVIAAVVVIAVIVVIAFSSGSKPETPTTGGEPGTPSTSSPSMDVPSTGGNDATEPSTTEPSGTVSIPEWLKPFLSTGETEPPAPEVPKYEDLDLPASSGMNYNNDKSVSITVGFEKNGYKEMKISFGTGVSGTKQYIALNPHVEIVSSQGAELAKTFQFYFMPSDGYVTTITDAEYGDYVKDTYNSTFRRAMDYALPSDYSSDELPGTIWYMGAGEKASAPYLDVLVYNKGRLVATVRLDIAKDNSGRYYLKSIGNQNQLDADCIDEKIDDFYLDAMINDAWEYMLTEYKETKTFDISGFVVERRAIGEGSYFDYINTIEGYPWSYSKSELKSKELIVVSYRNLQSRSRPVSFYFTILKDDPMGNDYEFLGVDIPYMYELYELKALNWPGYTDTLEDSWYINPPF